MEKTIFDAIPNFAFIPVIPKIDIDSAPNQASSAYLRSAEIVVNPERAKALLSTQVINRKVNDRRVLEYKRIMLEGEWKMSLIEFDSDGHLINGQHRLAALSKIDDDTFSVPFQASQGFSKDAQAVMDTGARRSLTACAKILGTDMNKAHSAIVRAMFAIDPSTRNTAKSTSVLEVVKFFENNEEAVTQACKLFGGDGCLFAPVRAVVALAWPFEDHNKLLRFLEVWDKMLADSKEEKPIASLRVIHTKKGKLESGGSYRLGMAKKASYVLKNYLSGKTATSIREIECPWPLP